MLLAELDKAQDLIGLASLGDAGFGVAVRHAVAHGVHQRPRHSRMGGRKRGMETCNIVRGLPDDLKIPDDCVLRFFVAKKGNLGHILDVAVDTFNRLDDMLEVVDHPQDVSLTHRA